MMKRRKKVMTILNKRSEILFLYDATFINPNGDPVDSNKPRIDEETGKNIVTDVRLKRTIRDYLYEQGEEIFVREISDVEGKIQDAKQRADDFLVNEEEKLKKSELNIQEMKEIILSNILDLCIDVRLFGATIPIEKGTNEKSSVTLTGPVQFKMGQSLHRVKLQYLKGTGAFAAQSGKTQKTFREEYILPYSLICFYGVINENAAKYTQLTEEDVEKLLEGIWNGTKNLISRSKVGQQPRLLFRVIYKEFNYHIGELDKLISFSFDKNDEEIRDISEGVLDVTSLLTALEKNKEKIKGIEVAVDPRISFNVDLLDHLQKLGINIKVLSF